jgi:hypothetical protein
MKKLKYLRLYSPLGLYMSLIIICIIFGFLFPFLDKENTSSSQITFAMRIYALTGLICGMFLLSLLNIILFKTWVKKFWYINGFVTLITGAVITYFLITSLNY